MIHPMVLVKNHLDDAILALSHHISRLEKLPLGVLDQELSESRDLYASLIELRSRFNALLQDGQ